MSQNGDNPLKRSALLSTMEHRLQRHIEETTGVLTATFAFTPDTRQRLTSATRKMRLKMAKLRQWRNGTELYTSHHLDRFVLDILSIRLDTVRARLVVLRDTLLRIDTVLSTLRHCPTDVMAQRDVIESELMSLDERLEGAVQVISEEWMVSSEDKIASLATDILKLRSVVKEIINTKPNRKTDVSSSETKLKVRFEQHSEVNRVLRNAGRIRKLIKLLSEGGHMDIVNNSDCVDNDLEVLHRQLHRIQQWQNDEADFSKASVDDMEVIFAAIASHLKPEVDLDQSNMSRSGVSRSSSSNSDHSPDSGYPCPSPCAESTVSRTNSICQSDVDVKSESQEGGADFVEERLI